MNQTAARRRAGVSGSRSSTVVPDSQLAKAVVEVLETRGPMSLRRGPQRSLRRKVARRNLTRSAAVAAEIARRVRRPDVSPLGPRCGSRGGHGVD